MEGRDWFWPFKIKNLIYVILIYFAVFSSVPVEEQAEFKQLSDDIQELQQSLNQEFRQKTVSVVGHLKLFKSFFVDVEELRSHGFQLLKKWGISLCPSGHLITDIYFCCPGQIMIIY